MPALQHEDAVRGQCDFDRSVAEGLSHARSLHCGLSNLLAPAHCGAQTWLIPTLLTAQYTGNRIRATISRRHEISEVQGPRAVYVVRRNRLTTGTGPLTSRVPSPLSDGFEV